MAETTRLMAGFPCRSCGATLLVAGPDDRERPCSVCGSPAKAPQRLIDDLELGRKLQFDAPSEVQAAIDGYVEAAHVGPEVRGWVVGVLALLAGGLGAYATASAALEPALADYARGAGLGLAMVMLPFGFTLQFLGTTDLGRKVDRATRLIARRDLACPRCETRIAQPPAPGVFDCASCKASLATASGLVIADETPRSGRWKEAVAGALKGADWLNGTGMQRFQRVLVAAVVVACLTAVYFTLGMA